MDFTDRWMSKRHFALALGSDGQWRVEDLGTRNGTFVNGIRVATHVLLPGDVVRAGATVFEAGDGVDAGAADLGLIGVSAQMGALRHQLRQAARATVVKSVAQASPRALLLPVHITGETGAGKEVAATALHVLSGRKGPLVTRNVATLAKDLVATELFGHVRGAFTGAHSDRAGLFEAAARGTLFLDEIAEMSEPIQAALLTAVDVGTVMPVGSTTARAVDARIVTATHRQLPDLVRRGMFREDLHHRLTGWVVNVPSLRERRMDIGLLVAHFLGLGGGEAIEQIRRVPNASYWMADVLVLLHDCEWPGNVRQLQSWTARVRQLLGSATSGADTAWPDPLEYTAALRAESLRPPAHPAHPESDGFFEVDTTPQPGRPKRHAAEGIYDDPDRLHRMIRDHFRGNMAAFARWAAEPNGLRVTAARRKIYDVLDEQRLGTLRADGDDSGA